MVAVKATVSFCTYVGSDCITAHEGSTVYLPKQKADELVAGGLAVLVEDASPAPSQTSVSPYVPPAADPAKTHESSPDPGATGQSAAEEQPQPESALGGRSDDTEQAETEPSAPARSAAKKAPVRRQRQRTRK